MRNEFAAVGLLCAVGLSCGSASAQTTPEVGASRGSDLEEVVVTAQRRTERLQDVPISIGLVEGSVARDVGITNVSQIQSVVPGLTFKESSRSDSQGFSLRGIGSFASFTAATGLEQSVGIVVDGVVLGRPSGAFNNLLDIERVEVLRGAQGTLFGKNASAGLVQIVTKRPSHEFELKAAASYGSNGEYVLEGVLNAPIGEGTALRIAAYDQGHNGYINNVLTGKKLNNAHDSGIRVRLLNESGPLTSLISGEWVRRNADCCQVVVVSKAPGGLQETFGRSVTARPRNLDVAVDGNTFQRYTVWSGAGEFNYEISPNKDLTLIVAHREVSSFDNLDPDALPVDILNIFQSDTEHRQSSAELRFAASNPEGLEYQIGLFAFGQDFDVDALQRGTLNGGATVFGRRMISSSKLASYAGFGQATWHVAPKLRVIAGARYTYERYDVDYARTQPPGLTLFPGAPEQSFDLRDIERAWTWRAGAQYDVGENGMMYATISRGYKGPAANVSPDIANPALVFSAPETSLNYELGYKATFPALGAALNVAVFRSDFKDFQAQTIEPRSLVAAFIVRNAGKVVTQGVEADASIRPLPGLTIRGAVAYVDAELKVFPDASCYNGQTAAQGCIGGRFDASGQRPANAPKWSTNLYIRQDIPLKQAPVDLFVVANYSYRSTANFSFNTEPGTIQKGYGILNMSLGATSRDGRYRLSLYANNVFDKFYNAVLQGNALDRSTGGGYVAFPAYDAQRRVGIRFDYTH